MLSYPSTCLEHVTLINLSFLLFGSLLLSYVCDINPGIGLLEPDRLWYTVVIAFRERPTRTSAASQTLPASIELALRFSFF